ncbi:MAG: calcium/sodium antiporter [Saprospiraceae bacterium]|nr:calcium/sodium antiporter [Saprospiraceae bacterium]
MPDSLFLLALIFIATLALLVFSADKFIEASEKIGRSLGIPHFIIGVTVVALGTSLPELVSSIFAILSGSPEIPIGNVVGSNITNILLILGVVGVVAKGFSISFDFKKIDLPFFLIATAFLCFAIWDRDFAMWEAIVGLAIIATYLFLTIRRGGTDLTDQVAPKLKPSYWMMLLLGGIGIYFGAKYNVESIIRIGEQLKVSPAIIALTAVALGTSLPELFVSLAAIRKNNAEIVIGNVLGSNIFNALVIMGIPRFVGRLDIPNEVVVTSVPIMIVATVLFFLFVWDKKVVIWEAVLLLLGYIAFLAISISMAS